MALPSSGAISLSAVNTELGVSATATRSLNDSTTRTLFGKASGAISLSDGYGKANAFAATISSNQQNLNLRTWALANGWNGTSASTITVAPGVYIWSDSVSSAAMTIDGSWPGGVTLINQGYIMGKGGQGGAGGGNPLAARPGENGGPAVTLGTSATINNTYSGAYIGGGGGGGVSNTPGGGGGAGGGAGGNGGYSTTVATGGSGGAIGSTGSAGGSLTIVYLSAGGSGGGAGGGGGGFAVAGYSGAGGGGGGGGRIFPGAGGAGGQGTGGGGPLASWYGTDGGAGNAAAVTNPNYYSGAATASGATGGGGWGASGGISTGSPASPGAGGKAVALNGYTVTWTSADTTRVYGSVS